MIAGFRLIPGLIDAEAQVRLVQEVLQATQGAPFYHAETPGGKRMSVANTNLGPLGWVSDRSGYRYQGLHPVTGQPWPAIPQALADLWRDFVDAQIPPDACLVNRYDAQARLSLHQDADEADFAFPVLSISLGDTAIFRLGGLRRSDPTTSFRLSSGDVIVLAGDSRRAFHGVDRILPGSSRLIPGGGRLNLTLRRAAPRPAATTR